MFLPITAMVEKPSWKQLLIELVLAEKLDPWNIDITKVADSFYNHVKNMEKFDFHIPANIILACAILLKYKSNSICFHEEPTMAEREVAPEEHEEWEMQPLTLSWRIPPKRQITLQELVEEMERAIKYDVEERPKRVVTPLPPLEMDMDRYDLEEEMNRLMEKMRESADSEGIVLFSRLVNGRGCGGIIATITPLLHLAQRKSVFIRQDRFFDEIFINLRDCAGKNHGVQAEEGESEEALN